MISYSSLYSAYIFIWKGLLVKKDVMSDKILKESKVSSSTLRYESLGTYRKRSAKLTTSKKDVYLIGVTGGIACGKSSISRLYLTISLFKLYI